MTMAEGFVRGMLPSILERAPHDGFPREMHSQVYTFGAVRILASISTNRGVAIRFKQRISAAAFPEALTQNQGRQNGTRTSDEG